VTEPGDTLTRAKGRLLQLTVKHLRRRDGIAWDSDAERDQAHRLALLLGETVPTPEQRWADEDRWHEFRCRAMSPGFHCFNDGRMPKSSK